jgi:tetratricopeptide (TPR) repeat protein
MVGYSIPSYADTSVSDLLDTLKSAPEEEAGRLTRQIEAAWSRSGSASMDLLLRRGRKALDEEDYDVAIEHFTALTDHAPDFAEGWHGLARAYFEADLYGPTLDALGRALALNPDHYNALFGLGAMFLQFQDYPRAEEAFLKVLALHPHHEEAKQALDTLKREGIGREL